MIRATSLPKPRAYRAKYIPVPTKLYKVGSNCTGPYIPCITLVEMHPVAGRIQAITMSDEEVCDSRDCHHPQ